MSIRQRVRTACQPCRRRKRRCDGQLPCQSCTQFNYECSYADTTDHPSAAPSDTEPPAVASTSRGPPTGRVSPGGSHRPVAPSFDTEHTDDKFFEPNKLRYYDAGSAIPFPRALAMSVCPDSAPRIHSFAYNIGILPENFLEAPEKRIFNIIDLDLAERMSTRYFEAVNIVFAVVDTQDFSQRLRSLWNVDSVVSPFEALAAFVILLGSFFTVPAQFEKHGDLLQYVQDLLDRNDFRDAPPRLHMEHFQAWILRTIYVRCTTRPNIAWLSSSMTLHVAESLGLHREPDSVGRLGIDEETQSSENSNSGRRLFWLAWMLNRAISFEIGRSATYINGVNIKLPADDKDTVYMQAIQTYLLLYPDGGHSHTENVQDCLDTIASKQLAEGAKQPHLALMRADLALGLYREMHKMNVQSLEKTGQRFVATLKPAYAAVQTLLEDMQPWWWILSVPFQSVCAGLSIGKISIIQTLPEAMQLMLAINQKFGTKMTNEADQTARALIRGALRAKNEDAAILSNVLASTSLWEDIDQPMDTGEEESLFFWPNDY